MSLEVRFEAAEMGDFAAVNRLARQVHELHVSWRPDIYRKTEFPISQEDFRNLVSRRKLYVLRDVGGPVAYGRISTLSMDRPGLVPRSILRLEELCVDASHRRAGLGRLLMERLFALGRSFGCTDVQLTCDPHNAPGMAFYESLGMGVKTVQYQMKLSYQSCEPSKKACSPPWSPCALPAET